MVSNLGKLILRVGKDKNKGEFDFHFVKLNIFLDFIFPELFEGFPVFFEINGALVQELLVVAWNIYSFYVETPLVIHNFVYLNSERLNFVRNVEKDHFLFANVIVGGFISRYYLQILLGPVVLF